VDFLGSHVQYAHQRNAALALLAWDSFEVGNHRVNCSACGRPKSGDRTMGVTVDHDGGVAHCFRCGHVETYRPARGTSIRPGKAYSRPVQTTKRDTLSEYGLELWRACKPVYGVALDYLKARHCAVPPEDGDLRFHPTLKHHSGYVGPALVGLVTHAETRQPMTLHRTWVKPDGTKADVDPPRSLLGRHRKAEGVIRLWPDDSVTTGLGIAEGIETALSLAHGYKPVWACIDAGNLADFPVLLGIESLLIAVDNDPAGVGAARMCAERWTRSGVKVLMVTSDKPKADLNDVAMEAAK
jgi:putative DNA primase/helicase